MFMPLPFCFKDEPRHNCFAADVPGTCAETATSLIALRSLGVGSGGDASYAAPAPLGHAGRRSRAGHTSCASHVVHVPSVGRVGYAGYGVCYCCCFPWSSRHAQPNWRTPSPTGKATGQTASSRSGQAAGRLSGMPAWLFACPASPDSPDSPASSDSPASPASPDSPNS